MGFMEEVKKRYPMDRRYSEEKDLIIISLILEVEKLQAEHAKVKDYEEHAHDMEVRWQRVKDLRDPMAQEIYESLVHQWDNWKLAESVRDDIMGWWDGKIKKIEEGESK